MDWVKEDKAGEENEEEKKSKRRQHSDGGVYVREIEKEHKCISIVQKITITSAKFAMSHIRSPP